MGRGAPGAGARRSPGRTTRSQGDYSLVRVHVRAGCGSSLRSPSRSRSRQRARKARTSGRQPRRSPFPGWREPAAGLLGPPGSAAGAARARPPSAGRFAPSSTQLDWLRLATKLAERASPCAQYYVSVADRRGQDHDAPTRRGGSARWARRPRDGRDPVRDLEPLGRERGELLACRRGDRSPADGRAGYDVALGDTWQLNELGTAVRRGDGNARANLREFLRGLYEGDGSRPTKGAALIVGVGQRTATSPSIRRRSRTGSPTRRSGRTWPRSSATGPGGVRRRS